VTAATRGALRDSAVSLLSPTLLSPTQDHINDLRPPGERYKNTSLKRSSANVSLRAMRNSHRYNGV
jgi:hypothetical protein